jgi:16S rRNA (guanine966-N2)-methyltransferase
MSGIWLKSSSAVTRHARSPRARQRLRIIGGQWRGRRIDFLDLPQLRPTPDRVRETLFNWLQGFIEGSRCLDLFAGSGALGFEVASRGAKSVVMVDHDPQVIHHLRRQAETLSAHQIEIILADAKAYLAMSPPPFDIVFLDPPFESDLLADIYQALERHRALKPGTRIYLEMPATAGPPPAPASWTLLKSRRAGQVAYRLLVKDS